MRQINIIALLVIWTMVFWRHAHATVCGGNFVTDRGVIMSPNYPSNYGDGTDCTWNIQVNQDYRIMLKFYPPFRLEGTCSYDKVEVTDIDTSGSRTAVGSWCNNNIPPDHLSRSNRMEVKFHSDGSQTFKGFLATWEKTGKCGGRFIPNEDKGYFTSPNHPSNYNNAEFCKWSIEVDEGHIIKLIFDAPFQLESCGNCNCDNVKIFTISSTGTRTQVGYWCGTDRPADYLSKSHKIEVEFTSNGANNFGGFSASWEKIVSGCNQNFNSATGHIFTPNYPGHYPENKVCHWEIRPPSGTSITLRFDAKFNMELSNDCAWDYVEMRLDITVQGKWCGTNKPKDVVVSSGQTLYVTFNSDKTNTGKGFYASWTSS